MPESADYPLDLANLKCRPLNRGVDSLYNLSAHHDAESLLQESTSKTWVLVCRTTEMVFVTRRLRSSTEWMSLLFRRFKTPGGSELIHSRRDMFFHVIIRFILAIVGSLAAF